MTKGKVLTIAALAVLTALTAYFIIGHTGNSVPTLAEGFGILESEIEFRHIYPGWNGTAPLTIINGGDQDRMFSVSVEQPNLAKIKSGYEALPEQFYCWITIPEPEVSIKAGKYHRLMITLAVPADAPPYRSEHTTLTASDDGTGLYAINQFEVRIRVSDAAPEGLVTLALEAKWYIITAEDYD